MKNCYIISYDIDTESGKSYEKIIELIKGYRTWAHLTQSTWAVVTEKTASEIRDEISPFLGEKGRVVVIRSGIESAWKNTMSRNEWLKKYL